MTNSDLHKCDLDPIVCLNVQHLDPVSRDREAAVILGYVPGDVDLVRDAVLVRPGPGGELHCGLPGAERNPWQVGGQLYERVRDVRSSNSII